VIRQSPYRWSVNLRSTVVVLILVLSGGRACAAPPDANAFFEKKIRPLLLEKCVSCHGAEKQKGGLRLDSRKAALAGGDRGAALVPGKPDESLLIRTVRHNEELKMPQKTKLPQAEIDALVEWVKLGAPWPYESPSSAPTAPKNGERGFTAEEKAFWAFQPVRRPAVPPIENPKSKIANPIDAFILTKLQAAGLKQAPEADRRTLIRRVTFDLTGLPPTPEEIDAFVKDETPDAWTKLVERLLASSAYGEKWGRRWLDVARYADSNGMDENLAHGNAWRYRDWVIRAFNSDLPYDRFIRDQIAGDLVPGGTDAERADRLTATGFLLIGPKMLAEDDPMKMRMDIIDEQLDTIGQAVMGLTLGCARCHDHKFDPFTQADYYGMAGFFYSTKSMQSYSVVAQWNERPLSPPSVIAAAAEHDKRAAAERALQFSAEKRAAEAVVGVGAAIGIAASQKSKLAALAKARPPLEQVMAVEDAKGQNLRIHLRGNHLTLGADAPRRFLRIIAGDSPLSLGADRSGRLEFAQWLARPDNPLTPRVMVNRIWAGHFGAGLVRSMDNFGRLGERPTHPELLDWLADEFVKHNWSVKHLHRVILNSATYKMACAANLDADPDNKLLSHFNRRRLEAEELRDAMLAQSGLLDRTAGGTLLTVANRAYVTGTGNRNYEGYQSTRRSVYLPVIRSAVYEVLQTFDFPDPSVPNGSRASTTIPTQALMLMNGAVTDRAAEALARSLLAASVDDASRIDLAYQRIHGRHPTTAERDRVSEYLKKSTASAEENLPAEAKQLRAWRGLCRVLFASNEYLFVE
jgi:cytochrome c553